MRESTPPPPNPWRKQEEEEALKSLAGCVMFILMIPLGFAWTFAYAAVAVKLWDWYFVPAGYDPLPYGVAFGSFLIVGLYRHISARKDDRDINWISALMLPFFKIGFAMLFGWLGLLFI